MAQHGGARQPSNPAPVSGPGQLSRRTDGGPGSDRQPIRVPTGGEYGDAAAMMKLQQQAPLAETPGGEVSPGLLAGIQIPETTPINAESTQPGVPVTDGADLGPGADSSALGITPPQDSDMQRLIQYLPVFEHMAEQPGSSKAARNLVRELKGMQ